MEGEESQGVIKGELIYAIIIWRDNSAQKESGNE